MASGYGLDGGRAGRAHRPSVFRVIAFALLLGESVVILIPTIYGSLTPKLAGIPFFYWFQLLWIIVGMVVTGIAWLLWERADAADRAALDQPEGQQ